MEVQKLPQVLCRRVAALAYVDKVGAGVVD